MRTRVTNTVNALSPILGIGFLALVIGMMVYPFKTAEVKEPMRILTPEVQVGDIIRYEVDYCRYTDAESSLTWILVPSDSSYDGDFLGSRESGGLPTGCGLVNSQTPPVPEQVRPGEYYVKVVARYRVNPLRTITKQFVTGPVQVVQ